ncbi:MAG: tRNA (adenosine(37)-N6)-threonylcarbamoyltransferase complex transferase subunit TsaD, partial [Patescibacteria group bacterium]
KIDLVAVTNGPGLEPCLWVGVNFAKDLAKKLDVPLIPVNHIEAHILVNFLNTKYKIPRTRTSSVRGRQNTSYLFPAVALVVSGGHTQIILVKDFGQYQILGETRDDAAGECFDKVARILGLGYPGGPIISRVAALKAGRISLPIKLPRPMMSQKNYDFSFSGLKTAVLYDFRKRAENIAKSPAYIQKMCQEAQQAIIDVLISKTIKAAKDFRAKSLILGGGVASNDELRKQFKLKIKNSKYFLDASHPSDNFSQSSKLLKINFLVPPKNLSTDNAAMVAIAGYYNFTSGKLSEREIEAEANLRIS